MAEDKSVGYWIKELDEAVEREKDFLDDGERATDIYECGKSDSNPYNILFANTSIIQPAIFSNNPKPIIKRRYNDKDLEARLASDFLSRILQFFMDSNVESAGDFKKLVTSCVQQALVPGRGVLRFKYISEIVGEGEEKRLKDEYIASELVPWNRFKCGFAQEWKNVPWIAFEHFMNKMEVEENFPGIEKVEELLVISEHSSRDVDSKSLPKDRKGAKLAHVWEVWDKESRRVYFLSPTRQEGFLKTVNDPFQLGNFFPLPEPISLHKKLSSLVPIVPYSYYKEQAEELNTITIRIKRLIKALKVRGFYDSSLEGIEKVLTAEDNTLIPTDALALQDKRGLDGSIWLVPIEKIITTIQQLFLQRESIKVIIQELSGVADIMRGASRASETLGAQQMKAQWGGMRIGLYKDAIETYLRDSLRLVAELSVKRLGEDTLYKMTNSQLLRLGQKQQLIQQMQTAQSMGQQIPPEAQMQLRTPSFEDILQLCKDDAIRNFKIDVETNSTVNIENSMDKQEIGEFLNALAQFLNGALPVVQAGLMPLPVVKSILLKVTRRYNFGVEVEEELEKMLDQPPQQEDPKAEGDKQKMQLEMQQKQQELQMKAMEMKAREAELQQEVLYKNAEFQMKMKELQRKGQIAEANFQMKLKSIQMKAIADKAADELKGESDATV